MMSQDYYLSLTALKGLLREELSRLLQIYEKQPLQGPLLQTFHSRQGKPEQMIVSKFVLSDIFYLFVTYFLKTGGYNLFIHLCYSFKS